MKYFSLAFFLFPLLLNAQIFVDHTANGSNDGSTWSNAYTNLQDAIQNAPAGAEVWVAAGTYLPSPSGEIDSTFALTKSIDLYGGFAGSESYLSERDMEANLTILSGDYNNDDALVVSTDPLNLNFSNYSDNAKRIITAYDVAGAISLDGFTVSGGHAPSSGAAMLFTPDVELTVLIKNCTIKNNLSGSTAGAIRIGASTDEVLNFRLENSSAINNACIGGGLPKGGVLWAVGSGVTNADFINVLFHQNFSSNRGGALNLDNGTFPTFENCIFSENQATNGGAIFKIISGSSSYRNCTFYKNKASSQAAVIWNYSSGGTENAKLQNCIFYNNGNSPLYATGNLGYDISNTLIEYDSWMDFSNQGNSNSIDQGGNQFNVDPEFVDATTFDFNLSANSPMINSGDNTGLLMTQDHTGYISRIVDGTVDLGALEYHLPLTADVTSLLCFGESFGAAAASGDTYPPFTFEWSEPGAQGANPNNLPAGVVEVTVTNSIGDRDELIFTLVESLEITFTTSATAPTPGNLDGTAMVDVTGGNAPFTYEWNTNPVQTSPTASGLADGTYDVLITDANGCTTSASVDVGLTSAVQSADDSNEIEIGPNPFMGNVEIKLSGDLLAQSALSQILIYNTNGRLVYHGQLSSGASRSIDLSELSAGLYFMELAGKDLRFRKRLVKL